MVKKCCIYVQNVSVRGIVSNALCEWVAPSYVFRGASKSKRGLRWQYLNKRRAAAQPTPVVRQTASLTQQLALYAHSAALQSFLTTYALIVASTRTVRLLLLSNTHTSYGQEGRFFRGRPSFFIALRSYHARYLCRRYGI